MYEPGSGNRRQLQALIEKIKERREKLTQQQKEIAAMQRDLKKTGSALH